MFKKLFIFFIFSISCFASSFQITLYDLAHIVSKANNVNIAIDEDLSSNVTLFFTSPIDSKISLDTFEILANKKGFDFKRLNGVYYLAPKQPQIQENQAKEYEYLAVDIAHLAPEKVIELASSFNIEAKQVFASGYLLKFLKDKRDDVVTFLNVTRMSNNRYVRLTGEIIELQNDKLENQGVDFAFLVESINRHGDLDMNFFSSINENDFIKKFLKTGKNKVNLVGFLNYLKANGSARTITTPNLLIANSERSKFHAGQKIPIRANSNIIHNNQSSPYTTTNYSYIEIGLIVDVGARVFNEIIELDFKLDHIAIDRYTESEQAITSNKSFYSKFSVKNGERLIIAGLSQESETMKYHSVPLLSDIPFLGSIFNNSYVTNVNTSLIIVLRADLEVL